MTPFERAEIAAWTEIETQGLRTDQTSGSIDGKIDMKAVVRAILSAVREPSEEMADAGSEVTSNVSAGEVEGAYQSDAANTWRLMVDAMLQEG